MKKTINYLLIMSSIALINSCSSWSSDASIGSPQPPKNPNIGNGQIILPQIGESKETITESSAARQNESQPSKFKKITDVKGPGGAITQINVANPDGGLPDYYLTPKDDDAASSSNTLNPNQMSTPQWNVVHW